MAKFKHNQLAICSENTAALSMGRLPIHLTNLSLRQNEIAIQGHSVMIGYLDDKKNESSFRNESLYISI